MGFKNIVSLGFLAVAGAFAISACSSNVESNPSADPTVTDENSETAGDEEAMKKAGMYSCKNDNDCVAVDEGGCCQHGKLVAVNKHYTKAYEKAHGCNVNPRPMCPLYLILDTRVAQCNWGKSKCEMVRPEDIACGGHTIHRPHGCPDGYTCKFPEFAADVPGVCEKN